MFVYCLGCKNRHNFKDPDATRLLHYLQTTALAPPGKPTPCLLDVLKFTYDGHKKGTLCDLLFDMFRQSRVQNTNREAWNKIQTERKRA